MLENGLLLPATASLAFISESETSKVFILNLRSTASSLSGSEDFDSGALSSGLTSSGASSFAGSISCRIYLVIKQTKAANYEY